MEYFSLTSLALYAKTNRPIADGTLRSIVRQIAEAMVYLHGLKIAHRDIKPENILINEK
jgi:serine/threonine protein kinase